MITQIEIDGFKTFLDFKVELAQFQVIVGPNASGKSNLFDALRLLSRLAEVDLRIAFQELRGDAHELFTLFPDGKRADHIHLAVEMLVDRNIQSSLGEEYELVENIARKREATLKYTRLRYELEIRRVTDTYGLEQLQVAHESLRSIPVSEDSWIRRNGLSSQNKWLPTSTGEQKTFISTEMTTTAVFQLPDGTEKAQQELMIHLYREEQQTKRLFSAQTIQQTALSSANIIEFPHAFAVREELRSLRFLHLSPGALRQPSSVNDPSFLAEDGKNLPAMIARMQTEDKFALADISLDMTNLVPGIVKVRVERDKPTERYFVWVQTDDERIFSAQVLSDGTLRLLTLAALRNDLQFHGILCLEEPENGVHPLRLKKMAHLLRGMATDFTDSQQVDEPLRQVLVTTHSPVFISQSDVLDALLFAYTVTHVEPRKMALGITYMTPVITLNASLPPLSDINEDRSVEAYTLNQVIQYLNSEIQDEARKQLEKARTSL